MYQMLEKHIPGQYHHYQPGIGTYVRGQTKNSGSVRLLPQLQNKIQAAVDHVLRGYEFIMRCYSKHDDVYIFGFSRGAYTALEILLLLQTPRMKQAPLPKPSQSSSNNCNSKCNRKRRAPARLSFAHHWTSYTSTKALTAKDLEQTSTSTEASRRSANLRTTSRGRFGSWPEPKITIKTETKASPKVPFLLKRKEETTESKAEAKAKAIVTGKGKGKSREFEVERADIEVDDNGDDQDGCQVESGIDMNGRGGNVVE